MASVSVGERFFPPCPASRPPTCQCKLCGLCTLTSLYTCGFSGGPSFTACGSGSYPLPFCPAIWFWINSLAVHSFSSFNVSMILDLFGYVLWSSPCIHTIVSGHPLGVFLLLLPQCLFNICLHCRCDATFDRHRQRFRVDPCQLFFGVPSHFMEGFAPPHVVGLAFLF